MPKDGRPDDQAKMPIQDFMRARLGLEEGVDFEDDLHPELIDLIVKKPRRWTFSQTALGTFSAFAMTIAAVAFILPSTTTGQFELIAAPGFMLTTMYFIRRKRNLEPWNDSLLANLRDETAKRQLAVLLEVIEELLAGKYKLVCEDYKGRDLPVPVALLKRRYRLNFLLPRKGDRGLVLGGGKFGAGKYWIFNNETKAVPETIVSGEPNMHMGPLQSPADAAMSILEFRKYFLRSMPLSEFQAICAAYREKYPRSLEWHMKLFENYRARYDKDAGFRKMTSEERFMEIVDGLGERQSWDGAVKALVYNRGTYDVLTKLHELWRNLHS